jgi:mono/diheme cytochrome c family protein
MSKKIMIITGSLLAVITMLSWTPIQDKKLAESKARGKELYEELCMTCHLPDGKGTPGAFPPLAKSDYFAKNPAKAIYAQKYGLTAPITVNGVKYNVPMPPPSGITNEEIADITTYIMNSWGNKGKLVTLADVQKVKK